MKNVLRKAPWVPVVIGLLGFSSQNANACGQEPFLGGMCVFAGNFAPRGYALAQGQLLPINQNQALFSILGTTYGGDGRTTFQLPDLRGRVAVGRGQAPGLMSYQLGQRGGVEFVVLNSSHLPSHTHSATTSVTASIDNATINANSSVTMMGNSSTANSNDPGNNALAVINRRRSGYFTDATPDVQMANETATVDIQMGPTTATASTTVNNTGQSALIENRSPFITMNWIIALQGLFPSRN